ncbi:MAG: VWA domain-containing protein [Acidimicrobiia bacterium]|nr:MAG: VWA domain-containing protein [Acidimicrobiia bacterium]
MLDVLTAFVQELREAGVPVSMVETIDATEALRHVDLSDRAGFKAALGATLVKNERHYRAFETAFEVFFALHRDLSDRAADTTDQAVKDPRTGQSRQQRGQGRGEGQGGGSGMDLDELRAALMDALRQQDADRMADLASMAVDQLAGIEPGRPVGGTYYLYRTMRQLDLDAIRDGLLEDLEEVDDLRQRLAQEEVQDRLDSLRAELEAEIRRRLVADRGREAVARTLRRPLVEDLDLMHATRADMDAIEDVIRPLTRKLATRLAQRRKRRRDGRLDYRKTMRHSLAAGGVPIEPVFKSPKVAKPELFLLCDISGSMATFARFTLQFVYAMNSHFSKLRSFAFIDSLDEVTDYFGVGTDFPSALQRVSTEAEVVHMDGHSDYGRSLELFWSRYGDALTPRSTVIIAGDARNNYRTPHADVLDAMQAVSRGVYWLNPEPRSYWDTGDSVMGAYARHCDAVREVRNLRQLEEFVEEIALPRPRVRA